MASDLAVKLHKAEQLLHAADTNAAKAILLRLLRDHAQHPEVNQLLSLAFTQAKQYSQALYYAQASVQALPESGELLTNLGNCLIFSNKHDDAILAFERALALNPTLQLARHGLTRALIESNRLMRAIEVMREHVTRNPNDAEAARTLAGMLIDCGNQDEAIAVLSTAVGHLPNNLSLLSGLSSSLNYPANIDPTIVLKAHRRFGEALAECTPAGPLAKARPAETDARLRIGLLSADFRAHSCSSYSELLIEHLDRSRFFVVLYDAHGHLDEMSKRLKSLANLWRTVYGLSDEDAAALIAQDQIDILIEMNGHTAGQRFGIMQRRPAPLQGTYLGYPNTTGVKAIDFRFVDSKTDPPGFCDTLAVEKLVRLDPSFLCYRPPREAGDVSPAPHHKQGFVTLGSFNALPKLTTPMVNVWTRATNAIPGAKLVLKHFGMRDPDIHRRTAERFEQAGLDPSRLILLPPNESRADHLASYGRIDLGLDTFPYHGTTTTCEAFFMGVPVVTLEGRVHAARVGVSLLDSIGLPELIARDEDDFVRIVAELGNNPSRLAELRASMRDRLMSSPLCDGPAFGKRVGDTLISMWRKRPSA